jgi:hypothetical protein
VKILFVLISAVTAAALPAFPQADPVFRSGVSLVRVDAQAIDGSGQVVSGLIKDDFRVLDEGEAQTLLNFSFAEEPLDLILLFDMAGSMHGKVLNVVRAAELGFRELRRGDRVDVMIFNTRAQEIQPFTEDLQAVNEAILLRVITLKFGGGSQIDAPAGDAALRFRREPRSQRKRGILVLTDKTSSATPTSTIRDLWQSDAVLSELVIGGSAPSSNPIVDQTGGATIVAGNPGEAFQQSVHYLRSGYAMYYATPGAAAGTQRRLQVSLTPDAARRFPNVRIHARAGYVVNPL